MFMIENPVGDVSSNSRMIERNTSAIGIVSSGEAEKIFGAGAEGCRAEVGEFGEKNIAVERFVCPLNFVTIP
jgi:hypothetical protein